MKFFLAGILFLSFGCNIENEVQIVDQAKSVVYKGRTFSNFSDVQKELIGEGLLLMIIQKM